MRCAMVLVTLGGLVFSLASAQTLPADAVTLDAYNVVWSTPSANASGAMPLGNGEVGLNLWVEPSGDLVFYLSRTDAWSEVNRLLKLGAVRVQLDPPLVQPGSAFRQELKLRDGCVEIACGDAALRVFVDADNPVVHVTGAFQTPRTVRAALECWRNERHRLSDPTELKSSWTMRDAPADVEVWESADVVVPNEPGDVVWYHRNEHSIVPFTLRHQGLQELQELVHDPLLHRTFGGCLRGEGLVRDGERGLRSAQSLRELALSIATLSAQCDSPEAWVKQVRGLSATAPSAGVAREATARWWAQFWARSWVFVRGDEVSGERRADDSFAGSRVTRAYVLQRWIAACGGRGAYPIKFNGSIFTVEPVHTNGAAFNADWRNWGGDYWWQNTRLPYYPMLAQGDFEMMQPLFAMYRDVLPLCESRAKLYYGAEGAYFPETMTSFGTYANGDYGWQRSGVERGVVQCPWWQYAWQQGLELVHLMLDYYAYTGDEKFLREELLPMARSVLRYYGTRFKRDERGRLVIQPTQAVETYWHEVVNDMPSVAGLHAVLDRLLALPTEAANVEDRAVWQRLKAAAPVIPLSTADGKQVLAPAERFNPQRSNVETPELYAVFPFRLYGVGREGLDAAREAYARRVDRSFVGWTQDGTFAAMLGLTDEARQNLLAKVANTNSKHRFPAMWGPNFDWLPDQDHGSNLMLLLQAMLMQSDEEKIYLLPAWPKNWDAAFQLHAPGPTVIRGVFEAGMLKALHVSPESRRSAVVICPVQ